MKLVLVVEDDPDVGDALGMVLVAAGYRVVVVPDGEAALARLADERPAAILADFTLPRISGGDLGLVVRANPALAGIPFVIASGHSQSTVREAFTDYDAFVAKPLSPEVIVPLIAHLTRYGRPAQKSL
ncbi:MAG: response regulator [Burkholderiales bacterium]|nr:response regulator [Burkholderiales bacterium]